MPVKRTFRLSSPGRAPLALSLKDVVRERSLYLESAVQGEGLWSKRKQAERTVPSTASLPF